MRLARLATPLASLAAFALAAAALAYPQPSPYPITWELKHELNTPKRLVVDGKAYWYVTYTVRNDSGQERVFLPRFELLTPDGKLHRADRLIPIEVVNEVRKQAGVRFLEQYNQIAGEVRLGEDQSRDGVTIWPEPSAEDREFTLFFTGFSGETAKTTTPDGTEVTLFKSLKLDYTLPGDPKFRAEITPRETARSYVMR